ncbi:MAG TPA: type I DNA topoisomerase [Alphaproteobacteria bacterium]|nr:type I DNA topoisomerase [Alphaproteobacteria bacterium]
MNVVVVESPAKARTINKYLGSDYTVLASYGHVRDLPPKDGSVRPEEDFAMDWEVDTRAERRLREIAAAVRSADQLILATDPDREGEAISWHISEELKRRRALKDVDVRRVVFNEITRTAVLNAMAHPRGLDHELIEAYLARRALDYLVGFTLSPVLWRKLPGSRSAGRVQSVALRLVCEREAEIEAFRPREYWSIEAIFETDAGAPFTARLVGLEGRKLDKFELGDQGAADAAARRVREGAPFIISGVERKQVRRNPPPPFTTSTLQQEASRKLGLSATRTMRVAQKLYEGVDIGGETVGLITYMRTDGVQLAGEAIAASRRLIEESYGAQYLPGSPRQYKSPAKNAQEAHEAIRPTDLHRRPQDVARALDADERRLYELIWKRTVASQMENAVFDQVSVDITGAGGAAALRATGSVLRFDGFLTLYREDEDDPAEDESERRLPPINEGDRPTLQEVHPEQHFTQPPPRYTEASLVKRLEELGIGRPSTYASILQVLQDRDYVRLEKKRFVPEDRGRLVTAFLTSFFERYVQYNFTADLENQLDDISGGRIDWRAVLRNFWRDFHKAIDGTRELTIGQVIEALDRELGPHFFPDDGSGRDPRLCPACKQGRLGLRLGRSGGFIGCSSYPNCTYTRPLALETAEGSEADAGPRDLGRDPETDAPITLRKGPYGWYVQLGEAKPKEKPKRASLPKTLSPSEIDLEKALALLSLPRTIGRHPETGEPITAGIGRYGPYIKHSGTFKSLGADDDVLSIGLNRAVSLLAEPTSGRRRDGQAGGRSLGEHPADGKPVTVGSGRYGPYVRHNRLFASIPRDTDPQTLTLDQAVQLLEAQAAKSADGSKSKAKSRAKPRAVKSEVESDAPTPRRRRAGSGD